MSDDQWEANSVRLTVFPAAPLDLSGDYWRSIFGEDPEGEEIRSRDGLKRQFGPWKGSLAEVQINPARVDLVVGPAPDDPPMGMHAMPSITIGPALEWLDLFADAVTPWLAALPFQTNRMAVSGCAMLEKESVLATYEVLQQRVRSVAVRPGVMRDMFFRVNWPRPSKYVSHYNDLQTWASINYTVQNMMIGQAPLLKVIQQHFAQLQFDANTAADQAEPLAPENIVPIFQDLLALVRQGVIHGEQPSDA